MSEPLTATRSETVAARRAPADQQLAAKRSLKMQIARLEAQLSALLLAGLPHLPAPRAREGTGSTPPRIATLAQLERRRDTLVAHVRHTQTAAAARIDHEREARALLRAMQLEPGRYKFFALRAADVGEAGCGVWHVRPRLGIVGMLAGWWQVKLSSGCPLASAAAAAAAIWARGGPSPAPLLLRSKPGLGC
ncbi:MAG: hypothetical protein ACYCUM_03415 [Solirubrobacteraceae bacterium]